MTPKFAQIDSFSPNDMADLFTLICKEIALKSEADVKKDIIALIGPSAFRTKEITAGDILNTISFYDIKFSLNIEYAAAEVKKEVPLQPAKAGLKLDETTKALQDQKTEITNPDLAVQNTAENNVKPSDDDVPLFN